MSKQIINAKTRTTTGKTAAKNLRKEGRIPIPPTANTMAVRITAAADIFPAG